MSDSAEVLGKGTFGKTYIANSETGRPMAVKRLRDFYDLNTEFGENEFRVMVDAVEKTTHENILPLTAYYNSKGEQLLVYDYMPMGSLYALLHANGSGGRSTLNLETRISVALGAARAIAHIHSQSPTTYHGNIKSSNILLTTTLEARLSDYGPIQITEPTPAVRYVDGYSVPLTTCRNRVSQNTDVQKADVYSFGVLFLEMLTGKDPSESYLVDQGMDLARWMLPAVNDEWTSEVVDVELLKHENVEVLLQCLELAFIWTARDPDIRPSMSQVITQIEKLGPSCSQEHDIAN